MALDVIQALAYQQTFVVQHYCTAQIRSKQFQKKTFLLRMNYFGNKESEESEKKQNYLKGIINS